MHEVTDRLFHEGVSLDAHEKDRGANFPNLAGANGGCKSQLLRMMVFLRCQGAKRCCHCHNELLELGCLDSLGVRL